MPAYHRRYDFFISKFSQMCHFETNDPSVTTKIRVSGLQGIGGVVRKIENEDLAENIWSPTHMDKIIPSLLYNIQIGDYRAGHGHTPDLAIGDQVKSPLQIAEDTFRKLMGRAGFLSIKNVMKPILMHLDIHQMWTPPDFAEHTFQMIMFSIQQQVNYIVIEMLMAHLDNTKDTKVRVGIATVLSRIFTSRAIDASVGPSVLEAINELLKHLKNSVTKASESRDPDPDDQRYREALLTALGEVMRWYYGDAVGWAPAAGSTHGGCIPMEQARNPQVGGGTPGDGPQPNNSWGYQSCTENLHAFSVPRGSWRSYTFDLARLSALCAKYYQGVVPQPHWLETWYIEAAAPRVRTREATSARNLPSRIDSPMDDRASILASGRRSGGYAIGGSNAGSNIIWSNGKRDPWHGGGFLRESDALPGGAVFVMRSTAHHQDLRAPSPNDPAELVIVRKKEEALIRQWIQEY